MPFASINPTNPRINPWNFHKKKLRIGIFEKLSFLGLTILEFFFQDEKKCFSPIKISQSYLCIKDWVKILVITLVYSKRVSVPNNLLHSVYKYNIARMNSDTSEAKNSRLLLILEVY